KKSTCLMYISLNNDIGHCKLENIHEIRVIPLGGARDAKQAEQNTGALGWRLTNEEIAELESYRFNPANAFWQRFWQHG
ncbi:unnamed protein product, partial [Rotaria sordida]